MLAAADSDGASSWGLGSKSQCLDLAAVAIPLQKPLVLPPVFLHFDLYLYKEGVVHYYC